MAIPRWITALEHRLRSGNNARRRQGKPAHRFVPGLEELEDRNLLSTLAPPVPVPAGSTATRGEVFWNGGAPLNPAGVQGIANAPSQKLITLTNNSDQTIYPILRDANTGQDGANKNPQNIGNYYDPQDFHNQEYRAYIGYVQNGNQYLGLPPGATITIRVPVVFWDAENTYIATDGTDLIPANAATDSNPFRYDPISDRNVSTSTANPNWVTTYTDPNTLNTAGLVMFYHAKQPQTPALDSPAQLTEFTIRDTYLNTAGVGPDKGWLWDPTQTIVLFNYDVSYVDNLTSSIAMEAESVPIPVAKNPDPPVQNFGWAGSNLIYGTPTTEDSMQNLIDDFINNTGPASIGQYFGAGSPGWPSYFNPGDPLQLTSINVTSPGSGYATPAAIAFSGGTGFSRAAQGTVVTANGQVIGVTITDGGQNYKTAPSVTISGGGGKNATGTAIISNGVVTGVQITSGGSGYLSVNFKGGGGVGSHRHARWCRRQAHGCRHCQCGHWLFLGTDDRLHLRRGHGGGRHGHDAPGDSQDSRWRQHLRQQPLQRSTLLLRH